LWDVASVVVEVAKSFPGGWTAVGDDVEADERL
jgi:hypothetical protein